MAYVLLAFPSGSLTGRLDRPFLGAMATFVAAYAVAVVLTLEPAVHGVSRCPPCVPNPLRITDLDAFPVVATAGDIGTVASALTVGGLSISRWYGARGAARRLMAPVLFGGIVIAAGFIATSLVIMTGSGLELTAQILILLQILIPIGLAVTFLRAYAARERRSLSTRLMTANG